MSSGSSGEIQEHCVALKTCLDSARRKTEASGRDFKPLHLKTCSDTGRIINALEQHSTRADQSRGVYITLYAKQLLCGGFFIQNLVPS